MSTGNTKATSQSSALSFIHSSLDDFGLTVAHFRVYAHVSRRCGGKEDGFCFSSVPNMARACRLHEDTTRLALHFMVAHNLLHRDSKPGQTTVYRLTLPSTWRHPSETKGGVTPPKPRVGGTPKPRVTHPSESKGDEGTPSEGTPFKGPLRKKSVFDLKDQIGAIDDTIKALTEDRHVGGDEWKRRPKPGQEQRVRELKAKRTELKAQLADL